MKRRVTPWWRFSRFSVPTLPLNNFQSMFQRSNYSSTYAGTELVFEDIYASRMTRMFMLFNKEEEKKKKKEEEVSAAAETASDILEDIG